MGAVSRFNKTAKNVAKIVRTRKTPAWWKEEVAKRLSKLKRAAWIEQMEKAENEREELVKNIQDTFIELGEATNAKTQNEIVSKLKELLVRLLREYNRIKGDEKLRMEFKQTILQELGLFLPLTEEARKEMRSSPVGYSLYAHLKAITEILDLSEEEINNLTRSIEQQEQQMREQQQEQQMRKAA